MSSPLDSGFLLDRQWYWLEGEMEQSKRPALLAVGRILGEQEVPYALIGGLALQIHQREPRTTLDIDVAVIERQAIPRNALIAAGFVKTGSFEHSENWAAPDGTPVQFSDDPLLAQAVAHAETLILDEVTLRVIRVLDLLHAKLRAAADPARRRSKRFQDLADAQALIEAHRDLQKELSPAEQTLLARLPE